MQHEELINVALADAPVTVLCPYDAGRLHPGVAGSPTGWPGGAAGRLQPAGRGLLLANRLCDLVQTYTGPDATVIRLHVRL